MADAAGIRTSNLRPVTAPIEFVVNDEQGVGRSALQTVLNFLAARQGFAGFDTRANLYANLDFPAYQTAFVFGDATPGYNGAYRKNGASGAGSWTRIGELPTGLADTLAAVDAVADDLADEVANRAAAITAAISDLVGTAPTGRKTLGGLSNVIDNIIGSPPAGRGTLQGLSNALDAVVGSPPSNLNTLEEIATFITMLKGTLPAGYTDVASVASQLDIAKNDIDDLQDANADRIAEIGNEALLRAQGDDNGRAYADAGVATMQAALQGEAVDFPLASRPGDAPQMFSLSGLLTGNGRSLAPCTRAPVVNTGGKTMPLFGGESLATRWLISLEPDAVYKVTGTVLRTVNSADPSGDSLELRIAYLNNSGALLSDVVLHDFSPSGSPLTVANGRQSYSVNIGQGTGFTNPSGAKYGRLYFKAYGTEGVANAIEVLRAANLTDAADIPDPTADFSNRLSAIEGLDLGTSIPAIQASIGPQLRWQSAIFGCIGDSRTWQGHNTGTANDFGINGNGWQHFTQILTGQAVRFPKALNYAVYGTTSEQALASQVGPCITAVKAAGGMGIVIQTGTNDRTQTPKWPLWRSQAALTAIINTILAAGLVAVVIAELPRGSVNNTDKLLTNAAGTDGNQLDIHTAYRGWQLTLAKIPGVYVVDPYPLLASRSLADGSVRLDIPNLFEDGLHPATGGAYFIGKTLAALFNRIVQTRPPILPASNADIYSLTNPYGVITANPMLQGSGGTLSAGGTGTLAGGYQLISSTGAVGITKAFSKVTVGDRSDVQQMVLSGTVSEATTATVSIQQQIDLTATKSDGSPLIVPGTTKLRAVMEAEVDAGASNILSFYNFLQNTGGPTITQTADGYIGSQNDRYQSVDNMRGLVFMTEDWLVPPGATGFINHRIVTQVQPSPIGGPDITCAFTCRILRAGVQIAA